MNPKSLLFKNGSLSTCFVLVTLVLSTASFLLSDDHSDAKKISVLLIDGQNNHDWKACSPEMINILEATGRFQIERATVPKEEVADFNPKWTKYDVVLTNYN